MRYLKESSARWQRTVEPAANLSDLKLAVRSQGEDSPCVAGLRSVCWKVFLLFRTIDKSAWSTLLGDSRSAYTSLRGHFLKYIEHPDELGSALDPLNDDKNSPWNILRQDEELRAEILQDVERCMPEEQFFRQPKTQQTLLDILFIYCKMNPDVGYRQGMHELLAPILWVVEKDALEIVDDKSSETNGETLMMDALNDTFIEHDAFTLFSLLMQPAKSFYELGEPERRFSTALRPGIGQTGISPIVNRSKRIHEIYLAALDPELADHLTAIEILPQIFLIRWIRILFGREFPFDNLLCLWDVLFAEDPGLELVDVVCVAMLLRIRWQLVKADYSTALTLLLKYPFPEPPHGPQTFVEDALYLKENFDLAGATRIITKYSGRAPASRPSGSGSATPSAGSLSPKQKARVRRSPLTSPSRFLQHQGGVEALLQGAAKGVFERGERLGINKAVRDAVGEVKKNMQNLQSPNPSLGRRSSDAMRWSLDEGRAVPSARKSTASTELRNKQLSQMLEEALNDLRKLSASKELAASPESDSMDLAIAKLQFIQVYLDDPTMPLPSQSENDPRAMNSTQESLAIQEHSLLTQTTVHRPGGEGTKEQDVGERKEVLATEPVIAPGRSDISLPSSGDAPGATADLHAQSSSGIMEGSTRPRAPMPTRSSLAQSSFAFMLEPDDSTSANISSPPKHSSAFLAAGKRQGGGGSREKAYLFGDEPEEAGDNSRKSSVPKEGAEEFSLGTIGGSTGGSTGSGEG